MESPADLIESLAAKALDYGETRLKLAQLKAIDKTASLFSVVVSHSIVIFFAVSFLLFLSIGLAVWTGELLGKLYYGFFAVATIYGFISLFIYLFVYKWLKRRLGDHFINQLLK